MQLFLNFQLGRELMNTKKVFYLLILLAVIYNLLLMYHDGNNANNTGNVGKTSIIVQSSNLVEEL